MSAIECNAKLHEGYCNVKWYWMPADWRCITSKWIWLPLMAPLIQIRGAAVDRKTIWMLWRMTHLSVTAAVPHGCRLFFRHKKNKKQKCICSRIFAAVINVYRLHLQIGFSVWRSGKENLVWVPEGLKTEGLTMAACKIMMGDLLSVLKADIRTAACKMSVRWLWVTKLN